ncbi:MAG: hypothetical protein ACE5DX_02240 [Candidatus Dojkabacteria bacterium]
MAKKGFNLLRPQIEPPTVWTKVYDYIVGSARVIVILVELVVVLAFVVRLVVDVQSKNLDEEIVVKEAIVKSFAQAEARYVRIQNKTGAFNAIWTNSPIYIQLYSEINGYIPNSAREMTIQIDNDKIFITGIAITSEIGEMENAFKNSDTFYKQELDQLETEGVSDDTLGNFTLRAQLNELPMRELIDQTVLDQPEVIPTPTLFEDNSTVLPTLTDTIQ